MNPASPWGVSERAARLHKNSPVLDMTMPMVPAGSFGRFFGALDEMKRHGVDFVSLTVASDYTSTAEALRNIRLVRLLLLGRFGRVRLVRRVDDIVAAQRDGRLAVSLHFQGTAPVGEDLSRVEDFYRRGIRHMLLAYNGPNRVGSGCHEAQDLGLSAFGKRLVREMNRVGMLVDVAHTGYRTSLEAIEASSRPVVISHGNPGALTPHVRCARDEVIRAIAASGGVVGITGIGLFLGGNDVSTENYVRHIDHIVQLVGPAHAGIGLDYVYDMDALIRFARNHPAQYPQDGGYFDEIRQIPHRQLPQVTEALCRLGYPDDAISGILGGNWLRVLGQVWR